MYQYEGNPTIGLQYPPGRHLADLNNYTSAATSSAYSYQVSSHIQQAYLHGENAPDQEKRYKKKHRTNSKRICTPDVLRHKIKGAEGQIWTNLSSWTNGRVDIIDFGNSKKKDKNSSSKGSPRRNSVQSVMTQQHVYFDNNNYHYTYNASTNAHHDLFYMEKPKQRQPTEDQMYSLENEENDELVWALQDSKISDTVPGMTTSKPPSPNSGPSPSWYPASPVKSSNLSSLDSVSRWSTVAPTHASVSAIYATSTPQSSRRQRRGISVVGSISPSSSASNITPSVSTASRGSRARASSSPSAMDPNLSQQYDVLPENYPTSRAVETNSNELPQCWLPNKLGRDSHEAEDLPPSYSLLSCAQSRRNPIATPATTSASSASRQPSLRRTHGTLSARSTGTGQSYLSRSDLGGKTKEEKWILDQAESVLGNHLNSAHYQAHDQPDDELETQRMRNKYPMYSNFCPR